MYHQQEYNVTSIGYSAFSGCSSLTSITIPNSVTSIGDAAFASCDALTSITIPNNVTSIRDYAFNFCSSLTSITIPNSVTSIGCAAFAYCSSLTSITIPNSVTSIGDAAFAYCSSLTSITIPNSVTSIGYETFEDCSSLTSVTIGNSVTSIRDKTFSLCSSLTSISIPNSVTSIGNEAFYGCKALTSISIPNSVTSIGERIFRNCLSLSSITWNATKCKDFTRNNTPFYYYSSSSSYNFDIRDQITSFTFGDSVEYIPVYLCYGMDKLTSITIPNSVTSIGNWAFSSCDSLTSITIPNSVTSIGYAAFSYCSSLTSITIPNSVTYIEGQAFRNCSSLTSISIPNSVTSIGHESFYNCSSLTSISIPNSVTSIDDEAFAYCLSLTSISIPNSVTSIGRSVFSNCSSLSSITWNVTKCEDFTKSDTPFYYYTDSSLSSSLNFDIRDQITSFTFGDSVEYIPAYLCYGMDKLTSISIPNSITSIGNEAFSKCSSLTSVQWNANKCNNFSSNNDAPFNSTKKQITSFTFGDSVEYIPTYLCYGMDKLTSITIPNSVTLIGDNAFSSCSSLTSISIPNSVTSIGYATFSNCSSLTSISIPNSVTYIGYKAFSGCSSLTSITIPNSVTSIGEDAFYYCTSLTSISIPNSVTYIGYEAFSGCTSLTSITIPNSVTSIGSSAFSACTSLTSITIPNSVTSIGNSAFFGCSSLSSITWNATKCEDFTKNNTPFYYYYSSSSSYNFDIRDQITSFTFGDSVEYIPAYLCYGMDKLTSITIPNSITKIGAEAFYNCYHLNSVNISNIATWCNIDFQDASSNPLSYAKNLYLNGEKVVNLIIPEGVNSINYTFNNCIHLQSVTIPNSITQIGKETFNGCNFLTTIVWNAKKCADFSNNDKQFPTTITSFTFGDSVEYIPSYLCSNMENLTSITVNATTPPTLGKNAFHNNLKYIYIPDNTISAYKEAWGTEYIYINNETSVNVHVETPGTLADEIVELGKRPIHILNLTVTGTLNDDDFKCIYETMTSLLTVDLYDITNTTGINFNGKSQLQKVILPQCLTKIDERTFANCSNLTSITIPSQVNSIEANAFSGCSKLDTITCLGLTPPEADNLGLNPEKCVLIVSSAAYKDYLKHNYWGKFLNIKTIDINYKNLSVVTNNNEWGTTMGAGAYIENEKAILTATANKGYLFKEWSDGNTENPRIIVVTEDIELTAIFEEVNTPVENTLNNQIGIYSIDGTLHIKGLESDYQIYTTTGQFIYSGKQTTLTLPRGIYLIIINGKTHKIAL